LTDANTLRAQGRAQGSPLRDDWKVVICEGKCLVRLGPQTKDSYMHASAGDKTVYVFPLAYRRAYLGEGEDRPASKAFFWAVWSHEVEVHVDGQLYAKSGSRYANTPNTGASQLMELEAWHWMKDNADRFKLTTKDLEQVRETIKYMEEKLKDTVERQKRDYGTEAMPYGFDHRDYYQQYKTETDPERRYSLDQRDAWPPP
jgi:hypothetical protein